MAPVFEARINAVANDWTNAAGTVYLHTEAPTNASPTNGRVTEGGGTFASGASVTAGNWSVAASGDVSYDADVDFGTATSAITDPVTHWSYYEGSLATAFGTLPSTTVASGDTYKINSGTIQINGAST